MRSFLAFSALVIACAGTACAGRADLDAPTVTSSINAAISAATLGNDCGASKAAPSSGDCAAISDAGEFAPDPCGGGCQQSNMQLALTNNGKSKAAISVVEVHLLDASSGARVDNVSARNARIWDGSKYVAWDAFLAPAATAKVSYDMTQFDWTKIGEGNAWNTFSRRYKVEVVLRIDGADRTLVSGELSREPEVVTQSFSRCFSAG